MAEANQTTEEFWIGNFGYEYTVRNRVDWRKRIPFWKEILDLTGARSVFEFGCNAGWNLSAIRQTFPGVMTYGYEINPLAEQQAEMAGIEMLGFEPGRKPIPLFDLTFTAGVLIHIAPDDIEDIMRKIIGASADYVLAIEYDAYCETEVEYRGHKGKLWKRPYGQLYQQMGLKLVMEAGAGPGFDDCKAWLLKK